MDWIKQGDTRPYLRKRLLDGEGAAVDLTGATVRFHMRGVDETVAKVDDFAVPDADQVTNEGWVEYRWATGDTDTAGRYYTEWEVTYSDGTVQTFPTAAPDVLTIEGELA